MKLRPLFLLLGCLSLAHLGYSMAANGQNPALEKSISQTVTKHFKTQKKALKSFLKNGLNDPENEGEKKKLPFGVIALISLAVIPLGILIGTGIGNLLLFFAWLTAVIFGLRGMKHDKNKFLPLIALAIALALGLSTITFVDTGLF